MSGGPNGGLGGGPGALAVPAGDPSALERLADRLDAAASGMDGLASRTARVTADVRTNADWTGAAAEGYTAFTGNLTRGVGGMRVPLAAIAGAVRVYAGYLRTAQEKASAYDYAVRAAQASPHPAGIAAANAARQDAVSAIADERAAGDRAAREVRDAAAEMDNPFGPDGAVRKWIEKIHAPWDALAGDALVASALGRIKQGEEIVKEAKQFAGNLPGWFQANARELNAVLEAIIADPLTQASETDRLLTDTLAIVHWSKTLQEAGEELTKGAAFWKSIAVGSDLLGIGGDVFTEIKPEDGGVMGNVDRGVAGVNAGISVADLAGLAGITAEVPIEGQVVLIGTGLYLGGDYLYHHWTPFHDVCNDIGHATVAGADDIAHAATSTAKDVWHGITSLF